MLTINQLQPGVRLRYHGKPYEIVKSEHLKMAQSHGIQRVRMRCLTDGSTINETFKGNQMLEQISFERKKSQLLYCDDASCHFMDPTTFNQWQLQKRLVAAKSNYLKQGQECQVVFIDNEPIDLDLPIKVTLTVTQAPPGVKGDRSQAGTKQVVLENGLTISAPLHVRTGDQIVVDTRTSEYVGRA